MIAIADAKTARPEIRPHLNFVDGLRAVAAIYALWGHIWLTVWQGHRPTRVVNAVVTLMLFLAIVAVCHHYGTSLLDKHGAAGDALVGLCAMSALVTASARRDGLLCRVLEWKPLVSVGIFSYSLYLIHAPILQAVWQFVVLPMHLTGVIACAVLLILGTLTALVGAFLFFLAFERPYLNSRTKHKTFTEVATEAALSPAP